MSKNSVFHSPTKYINLKDLYILDAVEDDEICVKHIKTDNQVADIFTKALSSEKFIYVRELFGMTYKRITFVTLYVLELLLSCIVLK